MHVVARLGAVEYCPVAQATHVLAPLLLPVLVIDPAGHSIQLSTLEFAENHPALQGMQELAPAAAPLLVREPATHSLQSPLPTLPWYSPGSQVAHATEPSFVAYCPAKQSVQAKVDADECFPTAHSVHLVAPVSLRVLVVEPSVHSLQLLANAKPGQVPYVPATQGMHDVARLDAVEYCPAMQAVQVDAPVLLPLLVIEPARNLQL